MQYFASSNSVSTRETLGSVEITEEQYRAALNGMSEGKAVSIEGGFNLVTPEPVINPEPDAEPFMATQDYLNRFTDAEYEAARTSPVMQVQRALDTMISSSRIVFSDPKLALGLDLMVAYCGMTPERKAELLEP